MLILASTSDLIRVVTDAAVTVDVHASWVDRASGNDTPDRTNTAISTATTTTVVGSPGASTIRNVRRLVIRNKSAASTVTVTVEHYDGTTAAQIEKRALGPGQAMHFDDQGGWVQPSSGGAITRPWYGVLAGGYGNGDPGDLMRHVQRAGWVGPTPTNIGTSVARCVAFILPADLTVNRLRAYGIGATTTTYRVAVYRMSDLARLTSELAFTTAANTWVSIGSALGLSLAKDTCYFLACSVNATGTTAGVAAMGNTTTSTTGQINTAPASLPGSMAIGSSAYLSSYEFQFAVTSGALPNPAATLAAPGAWTGGMPAFWLDSADV